MHVEIHGPLIARSEPVPPPTFRPGSYISSFDYVNVLE